MDSVKIKKGGSGIYEMERYIHKIYRVLRDSMVAGLRIMNILKEFDEYMISEEWQNYLRVPTLPGQRI